MNKSPFLIPIGECQRNWIERFGATQNRFLYKHILVHIQMNKETNLAICFLNAIFLPIYRRIISQYKGSRDPYLTNQYSGMSCTGMGFDHSSNEHWPRKDAIHDIASLVLGMSGQNRCWDLHLLKSQMDFFLGVQLKTWICVCFFWWFFFTDLIPWDSSQFFTTIWGIFLELFPTTLIKQS